MFAPAHWDPDLTCPFSSKSTPSLRLKELSASSSSSARLSTRSRTNDYADRTIKIALHDLLESIRKRPWHSLLVPSLRFQPPQNITAVREVSRIIDPIKQRRQIVGVDGKTKRYAIYNASISDPISDIPDGSLDSLISRA